MLIAVIDGQGGGIGKAVVEKLRAAFDADVDIVALGTNAVATSLMLKAGANEGASGENAIVVNVAKADVVIGSVAVIAANSMLGELTPRMAQAVAGCSAKKILLPLNRCNIYMAGVTNMPLLHYIDDAVDIVRGFMGGGRNV